MFSCGFFKTIVNDCTNTLKSHFIDWDHVWKWAKWLQLRTRFFLFTHTHNLAVAVAMAKKTYAATFFYRHAHFNSHIMLVLTSGFWFNLQWRKKNTHFRCDQPPVWSHQQRTKGLLPPYIPNKCSQATDSIFFSSFNSTLIQKIFGFPLKFPTNYFTHTRTLT